MPLVTITARIGAKGNQVAKLVAEELGVGLSGDDELKSIVTETGMTIPAEYNFDLQAPGFWERLRSRAPQLYLDAMEVAVYEIARRGDGVIIGHGSQLLLRDFDCAFHVRLLASVNARVANLISTQELNRNAALDLIAKYDKGQKEFFRYAFRADLDTASLYDLTLNINKMKSETIANLIVGAVRSDDIQSCSLDALSSMKKLAQERKIHSELLENDIDISTLHIAVPELGKAHITGAAVSQEEMKRIAEIVRNVDGISDADVDLSVWIYAL